LAKLPMRKIRSYLRASLLASFLGLALGYAAFYAVFPNVSVPVAGEPSLGFILTILGIAAVVAGLETESLSHGILQVFVALPLGGVVTAAMAFSPLLSGLLQVRGDELVFLVLRLGLPIYGGGTFVFFLGTLVGIGVRERLG